MKREICTAALLGFVCIFTLGAEAVAPTSPEVDLGARTGDRVADAQAVINRHGDVIEGPDELYGYPSTYVLVRFKPGVRPNIDDGPMSTQQTEFDQAAAAWGVTHATPLLMVPARNEELADHYGLSRTYLLHTPAGTDTPALAEALSAFRSVVEFAEIDGIGGVAEIPNDADFDLLYGMHNTGQTGGTDDADIDAPEAWDIFTGSDNITLAVIDSGVDGDHPELSAKMVQGRNTNNNSDDTSDGCPHGTHVSGTAGAIGNNEIGVAGVNWGVKIMPIRVLNGCGGTEAQCAAGIVWATDHGAQVGTMSLQYYTGTQTFRDSVDYAYDNGVLLIAANGNGRGRIVAYPAKFPHCMGIAATDHNDNFASFSNYGPECDLSAPGAAVWSCERGGGYSFKSGTSMSTPHVSGLATLMWSFAPSLTHDQIEQILKDSAEDKGPEGWDERFGWGRINAHQAMLGLEHLEFTFPDGLPERFSPVEGVTVRVEITGFNTEPEPGTGVLHYSVGDEFISAFMDVVSENVYDAVFPPFECGEEARFYFSALDIEGREFFDPGAGLNGPYRRESYVDRVTLLDDDFETDTGWAVVNENLDDGAWERGVPFGSGDAAPDEDFDGSGRCYVTGNRLFQDVDLGPTRLISPRLDVADSLAVVNFSWYFVSGSTDRLQVEVSNDDGGSWTLVEEIAPEPSGWVEASFTLADFVPPTANVRVRFSVADDPNDSFCEAALDAFVIVKTLCGDGACVRDPAWVCDGDVDGDGQVNPVDSGLVQAAFGSTDEQDVCNYDVDCDGQINPVDSGIVQSLFGTCEAPRAVCP